MTIVQDVDGADGIPDAVSNGEMSPTWYKPVRTDMRANQSFNLGLSATLSIPLNRGMQRRCKEAAEAQIAMQNQLVSNKRLDFEIARLKNCGELKKAGIMFHPRSPYASICADVVVTNPGGQLHPHSHDLPQPNFDSSSETPSSASPSERVPSQNSSEVNPSSPDNDSSSAPTGLESKESSPASSGWLRWPFSRQASPPSGEDQQAALLGGPIQLPQTQSLP